MAIKDLAGRARELAGTARTYAREHRTGVDNAVDAIGRVVDRRTGRKHTEQIISVKEQIKKAY